MPWEPVRYIRTEQVPPSAPAVTNPRTQIRWGEDYIQGWYGTPCQAWAFWQARKYYARC
jgi:hypothetical protein